MDRAIPMYKLPKESLVPRDAYELVKDQLIDEGVSRQNLATFCQTYMEPEAVKIMSETLDKNAIDKTEYPRTAEIENRCVNMIADLWHAPEASDFIGTSTVGLRSVYARWIGLKICLAQSGKKLGLDINKQKT